MYYQMDCILHFLQSPGSASVPESEADGNVEVPGKLKIKIDSLPAIS